MRLLASLALISTCLTSVAGLQPIDYIRAFQTFGESLLPPINGIFANETTPSFFSPGVVGRVDGTITLNGSQPSMEYVYGLLSQLSQTSEPSLFGIPSSLTTQSMSVEPPVVAASVIVNFTYNSINFVLPLQVDMWVVFDDDLKISSFDVAFRNRPAAFDYVLPKLVPWISQQINTTLTSQIDNSSLVTQFMAQDVCQVSSQYCTGNNQQYATIDACMQYQALQPPPSSFAWQLGDKNIMCRYLHRNLVPLRPQTYCPEIGPNGTNICVSRDYVNVTASPFQQTLIAWKSSLRPADISGLSSGSQEALVALSTERIYPTTVAWFPISMVVYWVILYISAKLVQSGFERYSTVYPTLSFENQRTAIIYILNVVYTTIVLLLQLIASPVLAGKYTYEMISLIRACGVMIAGLYLFELTYRPSMRWQLITHHVVTIFAIILLVSALQITRHPHIFILANIWIFQATTEQSIFIALLMYRFRFPKNITNFALEFSAVQSLLCKFAFGVYLFVKWSKTQARNNTLKMDIATNALMVILLSCLMVVQVYGSYIVWRIAQTLDRRYEQKSNSDVEKSSITQNSAPARSSRTVVGSEYQIAIMNRLDGS